MRINNHLTKMLLISWVVEYKKRYNKTLEIIRLLLGYLRAKVLKVGIMVIITSQIHFKICINIAFHINYKTNSLCNILVTLVVFTKIFILLKKKGFMEAKQFCQWIRNTMTRSQIFLCRELTILIIHLLLASLFETQITKVVLNLLIYQWVHKRVFEIIICNTKKKYW